MGRTKLAANCISMGALMTGMSLVGAAPASAEPCYSSSAGICLTVIGEPSPQNPLFVNAGPSGISGAISGGTRFGRAEVPEIVAATLGGGNPFPEGFAPGEQIPGNWIFTGAGGLLPVGGSALTYTATLEQPWTGHAPGGIIEGDLELITGASLTQTLGAGDYAQFGWGSYKYNPNSGYLSTDIVFYNATGTRAYQLSMDMYLNNDGTASGPGFWYINSADIQITPTGVAILSPWKVVPNGVGTANATKSQF